MTHHNVYVVPEFLRARNQWIVWWPEPSGDPKIEPRKTPLDLTSVRQLVDHKEGGAGRRPSHIRGNANDPRNFTDVDDAHALAHYLRDRADMACGVGYALTGDDQVVAFDFDDVLDTRGKITDARIVATLNNLSTWVEVSPSGTGLHAWCVVSPALKRHMLERMGAWTPFTQKGRGGEQHTVFAGGGYVTVTGNVHKATSRTLNMDCDAYLKQWFDLRYPSAPHASNDNDVDLDDGGIEEQVRDALAKVDPDCDRDTWVKVGMVLHKLTRGDDRGIALWDAWSRRAPHRYPKAREQSTRALYRSFDSTGARAVSLGTLLHLAKEWSANDTRQTVTHAKERLARTLTSAREQLKVLAVARGVTTTTNAAKEGALFVAASSLEVEATRWLWTNVVPQGHIVLVSGGVGAGKSSWMLKLSADTTHACPLPYDTEHKQYQQRVAKVLGASNPFARPYKRSGIVYYLTSEMHWAQTAVPTLRACGAVLDRVFFMRQTGITQKDGTIKTRPFDLMTDLDKLVRNIIETRSIPDLIVLDPITSFLGGAVDRNVEADVRSVLEMMADFCAFIGTAFVGVLHQNKSAEHHGVGKMLGSVAFGAVARVVLFVVPIATPERGEGERAEWEQGTKHLALLVEKSNIGPDNTVHTFRLAPSEQLGVAVDYIGAMSRADYAREHLGDGKRETAAPKRQQVLAIIKERCTEGNAAFQSKREAYNSIGTWANVSAAYVQQILDSLFTFTPVVLDEGTRLRIQPRVLNS